MTGAGSPAADRRFAADAEAHRRDAPRFCPSCGARLATGGLAVELWEADARVFYCWCGACRWTGEVSPSPGQGVVGHEPEH
jgi:hypothetical protein